MFMKNALKLAKTDNGLQCLRVLTLDWANTNAPELISTLLSHFETTQGSTMQKPSLTHPARQLEFEAAKLASTGNPNSNNIMVVGYINQFVVNAAPS
jgi:hypothetical protein